MNESKTYTIELNEKDVDIVIQSLNHSAETIAHRAPDRFDYVQKVIELSTIIQIQRDMQ